MKKIYLGDGVYAANDGYHIILTTSDGLSETNTIYLDDIVQENLLTLLEYTKKSKKLIEPTELDE